MSVKLTILTTRATVNSMAQTAVSAITSHGLLKLWTERYSEHSPNSGHELAIYVL